MKKYLVYILLIIPFSCWAQVLTGTVVDNEGQGIAFANIVLCQSSDGTIIVGCISDDNGNFNIETDDIKGKFLRVSYVGYKTKLVDVGVSPMRIQLESKMLDEVVVTGQRKLYEQKNGLLIANVKGTILETFPKTADVIAQLPFISSLDGNFSVFGKGTPLIYINNRLVQDMKELDRLMPSEIKSIKVNTMPGAKYDATVSAVIQIITVKAQGEGLSGTLYGSSKRSERWSTEEFASLNYRHKAWDIFGSAYLIQRRQNIEMASSQIMDVADAAHEVGYQEQEKIKSNRIAAVGGINYNPSEKVSAGIQYVYNHSNWVNRMHNDISHSVDNEREVTQQLASSDSPDYSHNINAYFSGNLKNNLTLDVNLDWMKGNEKSYMYSWFPDNSSDDVSTNNKRQYNYYASKGILSYQNKLLTLEAGTEYSYTDMTQIYNIDNTELGIDNSNDKTKQNRWALFVSAKVQFGNWGIGAGMRYEYLDFNYYKNKIRNEEQSKKYHKLFPNVFTMYSNNKVQAVLSYERKIKYPSYNALRSNIQYSSPYVYESGNPLLLPQVQNDFTFIFGYKDIKVVLGYTLYDDYLTKVVDLYDEKPIALMRPENMEDVKNRFFAISYTPAIGIWRPNLEIGGQWQDFSLMGNTYNKPIFKIELKNSLSFPHQWFLSANVSWYSKGNSGIYLREPSLQTNINISKWLFNRSMSVSLMVNDIFKTDKTKWSIDYRHLAFDYDKYSDSRYIQLTIRYNFNAARSKYKGNGLSDEKQRL